MVFVKLIMKSARIARAGHLRGQRSARRIRHVVRVVQHRHSQPLASFARQRVVHNDRELFVRVGVDWNGITQVYTTVQEKSGVKRRSEADGAEHLLGVLRIGGEVADALVEQPAEVLRRHGGGGGGTGGGWQHELRVSAPHDVLRDNTEMDIFEVKIRANRQKNDEKNVSEISMTSSKSINLH